MEITLRYRISAGIIGLVQQKFPELTDHLTKLVDKRGKEVIIDVDQEYQSALADGFGEEFIGQFARGAFATKQLMDDLNQNF
jgi:hypothetical protein